MPAEICDPPGGGGGKKANWTPAGIKKTLDDCDGGTGVWAAAKKANNGNNPIVQPGKATPTGSRGFVDVNTGTITLDSTLDHCFATQIQIQELSNLSHKQDFTDSAAKCTAGDLTRDQFVRAYEFAEWDGVHKVIQAFDACKDTWGCKTCQKEWARKYKTFDDYYAGMSNDHKENYGKWWDSNCKAAFDAKQPPPPLPSAPKKVTPPPSAPPPQPKQGCFIASAAYGSPMASEVQFLRSIRDEILRPTDWGHKFFENYWRHYYDFSPPIAARMDRDPEFRETVRWSVVAPMVNHLRWMIGRPRHWNYEGMDPAMREFVEMIQRDMDLWLAPIELPQTFEGKAAEAAVKELNIALDFVVRERDKGIRYLDGLIVAGSLPLRYTACQAKGLARALAEGGRSLHEMNRILHGRGGETPIAGQLIEWGLQAKDK
jgi:hypothetical protein